MIRRPLRDPLHPVNARTVLLVNKGRLLAGGEALEGADVGVHNAVDVRAAFVYRLGGMGRAVVPPVASGLARDIVKGWCRDSVLVPRPKHPWAVCWLHRWRRYFHRPHFRLESDPGLLSAGEKGLIGLVCPCTGAIPRWSADVESVQAPVEIGFPLRSLATLVSHRMIRGVRIYHHWRRDAPRGCPPGKFIKRFDAWKPCLLSCGAGRL